MATNERRTGLGTAAVGMFKPTMPPEPTIAPEAPQQSVVLPEDAAETGEDQGRGIGVAESRAVMPRARRKRAPVAVETRGRKIHLPDDIHDRLWLMARHKKTTVSAIAAEMLDKSLPRWKVEKQA